MPTPRGGGLGVVISFYIGLLILFMENIVDMKSMMLMLGAIPVVIVSWIDDHKHVSIKYRLIMQFISATWIFVLYGNAVVYVSENDFLLISLLLIIFILSAVWIINIFNFMDGIDGLAGAEFSSIMIALIVCILVLNRASTNSNGSLEIAALGFVATLGFLTLNWPPAKIFMGDVGSNFMGYVVVAMAIKTINQQQLGLSTWLILPAVFWIDASATLMRRVVTRQPFYKAHCSHAYQQAAKRLGNHTTVSLGVTMINFLYLMPLAMISEMYKNIEFLCVGLAYFPLLILAWHFDAGQNIEQDVISK